MGKEAVYRSYLLRLRYIVAHEDGAAQWRISVEETGSRRETPFVTLDALMIYLASQLQMLTAVSSQQPGPTEPSQPGCSSLSSDAID